MEIEITARKENFLLNREEIEFTVKNTGATSSRKQIREKLSAIVNADPKLLVVDILKTTFGSNEIKGLAKIYKNEKDLKKIELSYLIKRNFPEEKEKKQQETKNN
ncbi:MAG: 30S ribosomal protein S24e [Candidatus Diapherotrites archaeon]